MSESTAKAEGGDGPTEQAEAAQAALEDLPDGSGCTEIWDYLSERRRQD